VDGQERKDAVRHDYNSETSLACVSVGRLQVSAKSLATFFVLFGFPHLSVKKGSIAARSCKAVRHGGGAEPQFFFRP
jgi:hypothetical protein